MDTRRALFLCLIFFILAAPVLSLTVNPASQQLSQPADKSYLFVYSIINNDPQPRTLTLKLEPYSIYLQDKISFSKQQFTLMPGQAENIQLSVNPTGLGPETHTLKVGVYDGNDKLATFDLLITIAGTPIENYAVTLVAKDTKTGDAVPLSVELSNYGNIIGYAQLTLIIMNDEKIFGTLTYPDLIQVLPNSKVPYDLVYTDRLSPGFYTANVTAVFTTKNVSAESQFSVNLGQSTERIKLGSDLVLTFASLGNPPAVQYRLLDQNKKEQAAGTFLPQTGDLVIPTSNLPAGTYDLYLTLQSGEQHIVIIVKSDQQYGQYLLILVVLGIIGYAAYSSRASIQLYIRLYRLRRAIAHREAVVTNLINRSHRLVDEYSKYARRHQASGSSGAPAQRP